MKANSENSETATENVRMDSGDEDKLVVKSVWKQAIADANQANSCSPKRRQIALTLDYSLSCGKQQHFVPSHFQNFQQQNLLRFERETLYAMPVEDKIYIIEKTC